MRKTLLKCATEEVALPVGEPPSDIGEIEIKGKMERVDIHYEFPVIHKVRSRERIMLIVTYLIILHYYFIFRCF